MIFSVIGHPVLLLLELLHELKIVAASATKANKTSILFIKY
jgi:hypothetical protein